jgi:hypothetical protein
LAGAEVPTTETASAATAASATNVFLMASPFSLSKDSGQAVCRSEGFHISLERSMNEMATLPTKMGTR